METNEIQRVRELSCKILECISPNNQISLKDIDVAGKKPAYRVSVGWVVYSQVPNSEAIYQSLMTLSAYQYPEVYCMVDNYSVTVVVFEWADSLSEAKVLAENYIEAAVYDTNYRRVPIA